MYILLFIVVLLIVLFVMKTNVEVEPFKNMFKHPFKQVKRVDFVNNKKVSNLLKAYIYKMVVSGARYQIPISNLTRLDKEIKLNYSKDSKAR